MAENQEVFLTPLEQLKILLNPRNIHALWGEPQLASGDLSTSFGPRVIAEGRQVPVVEYGSLQAFDDVEIRGNVTVAQGSSIRRKSRVSGSSEREAVIGENALLMDNVSFANASIGKGAGVAHGATVEYADLGDGFFANIAPVIQGAPGNEVTAEAHSYIGPGVKVEVPGAKIVSNVIYYGTPAFVAPNTRVDPASFQMQAGVQHRPTPGGATGNEEHLTRYLLLPEERLHEAEAGDRSAMLSVHRLDPRLNLNKIAPNTHGHNFTDLKTLGVAAWIQEQKEIQGSNKTHRPAVANWLSVYVNPTQKLKDFEYILSDSREYGDIVWHSAAIQSEILQLDRARKVIEAREGALAQEVSDLIKSKLYILGAYEITKEEIPSINRAFLNASDIIQRTQDAVSRYRQAELSVFPQETIDSILLPKLANYNDQPPINLTLGSNDLSKLATYLGYAAEAEKRLQITNDNLRFNDAAIAHKQQQESVAETDTISTVRNWRTAINLRQVDISQIPDGPRVTEFHGYVPVINKGAILVGNVDVRGLVEVGNGAVIRNGTLRSEQTVAPVFAGACYIDSATVHTANKEQNPAYIGSLNGKDGFAIVMDANVHGAEIRPGSYIATGAVIGDESVHTGVSAPHALNPGQAIGKDRQLAFVAGNFNVDVFEKNPHDGTLRHPELHKQFAEWWKDSKFGNIPISDSGIDQAATKARVNIMYHAEKHRAALDVEKYVEKYGEIYRMSPHLQADTHNLRNAVKIIAGSQYAASKPDAVDRLQYLADGLDYLMGKKADISEDAAGELSRLSAETGVIKEASLILSELGANNFTVSVRSWGDKTSPYALTYEEARMSARNAASIPSEIASRNYAIANQFGPDNIDHVMHSEEIISKGIYPTIDYYPETISLLSRQLERVSEHVLAIREVAESKNRKQGLMIEEHNQADPISALGTPRNLPSSPLLNEAQKAALLDTVRENKGNFPARTNKRQQNYNREI